MAYGKIYDRLFDSSVVEDPPKDSGVCGYQVAYVFQAIVVLSTHEGILDMRPRALAARINMPQELVEKAIAVLESPDPESRSEEHDGRRIVPLDEHRSWGWRVVTKTAYRDMRDPDHERALARERKRRQRQREAEAARHAPSRSVTDGHAPSRHADTDTDTDAEKKRESVQAKAGKMAPGEFDEFWDAYPVKKGKKAAKAKYAALRKSGELPKLESLLAVIERMKAEDRDWREGYVKHPTTWLNQGCWDDEPKPRRGSSVVERPELERYRKREEM